MSMQFVDRPSDSPYIQEVSRGWTVSSGSTIRPAEYNAYLIFVWHEGRMRSLLTGPLPSSGVVSWTDGAEILWVKLRRGVFMPRLPPRTLIDVEAELPAASFDKFWLNGSAWQVPSFENAETFVARLVRDGALARDPIVPDALDGRGVTMPERTLRHRFLRATGLTQTRIRQIEQAQAAAALLRQGVPILDVVFETGYYDQPHLTRALRQWVGYTPAQLRREACRTVQDGGGGLDYTEKVEFAGGQPNAQEATP
jgi:hypothetical protein